MFRRICQPLQHQSFFLFGARATGKSTFLRHYLPGDEVEWIDLLDPELEMRYQRQPRLFYDQVRRSQATWIVVDEIQKCPQLLNYVHKLIEESGPKFALTGSSARKLKRGAANLLAGRALLNHLFPLTAKELDSSFSLESALHWGTLPALSALANDLQKRAYLSSYAHVYLKEEILAEQLIRKVQPFHHFLEVAAQCQASQLSFRKLSREIGVDGKTVQNYFEILEDTLVGFLLYPHHSSLRKSIQQMPKFYFFDLGVQRALARSLDSRFSAATSAFGEAFEAWIILEIHRQNSYAGQPFRLEYFSDGRNEIDLILTGGRRKIAIEIKSTVSLEDSVVSKFARLTDSLEMTDRYLLSQDPISRDQDGVRCRSWQEGLAQLFSHG
jgi:predicted AAA+ superfamily ATPase